MEDGLLIVAGVFSAVIFGLLIGSEVWKRRHYMMHPPDCDDGCREDREDDDS